MTRKSEQRSRQECVQALGRVIHKEFSGGHFPFEGSMHFANSWHHAGLLLEKKIEESSCFSPKISWDSFHDAESEFTRYRWNVELWCLAGDATFCALTHATNTEELPLAVSLAVALYDCLAMPKDMIECFSEMMQDSRVRPVEAKEDEDNQEGGSR